MPLLERRSPPARASSTSGQQNLKDIQHERIFQLALDEQPREKRPLKTDDKPGSRAESLALDFEKRVTDYVERQIEEKMGAVELGERPKPRGRWWRRRDS